MYVGEWKGTHYLILVSEAFWSGYIMKEKWCFLFYFVDTSLDVLELLSPCFFRFLPMLTCNASTPTHPPTHLACPCPMTCFEEASPGFWQRKLFWGSGWSNIQWVSCWEALGQPVQPRKQMELNWKKMGWVQLSVKCNPMGLRVAFPMALPFLVGSV